MLDWIKFSKARPAEYYFQSNGFATIKVAGFPKGVDNGVFMTYGSFCRNCNRKNTRFAPYTSHPKDFDEIVFVSDTNGFAYPEKNILAWMPYPEPYELEEGENTCCSCGRLYKKEKDDENYCPECRKWHDEHKTDFDDFFEKNIL